MCRGRRPPSGAGPPGFRPPRHVPECSGRRERLSEILGVPRSERASGRPSPAAPDGNSGGTAPLAPAPPERRPRPAIPLARIPVNHRQDGRSLAKPNVSQLKAHGPAHRGGARRSDWLARTKTGGAAVNHRGGVARAWPWGNSPPAELPRAGPRFPALRRKCPFSGRTARAGGRKWRGPPWRRPERPGRARQPRPLRC